MSNDRLTALRQGLEAARSGAMPASELATLFREHAGRLEELPERFGQVLEGVLMQLESGGLFTEESCSFSQQDLLESLQVWVDRAQARLGGPAS